MARNRRTNFRQPTAIAIARPLARGNRGATAGLVIVTALAIFISPWLALGMVGLMLWRQPSR